jgi:hypothetical protein
MLNCDVAHSQTVSESSVLWTSLGDCCAVLVTFM